MEKRKTTSKNFKDSVLCHLSKYKEKNLEIKECGIYRHNGKNIPKEHILSIPKGESKEKVVKEYNVLSCLKDKKFLIEEKDLHRFAHHLNSSQMMCYNFFRPYIELEEKGKVRPNKDLIKLLGDCEFNIKTCNDAECQFEYVQGDEYKEEGTNFDFYLRLGETEVFFEIKYTEEGFGKCKNDEKHEEKFKKVYQGLIGNCDAIKKPVRFDDEFRKYYQLFRNSIRAKDKNKYVVFIYDKNNNYCESQLNEFKEKYISKDYQENVKGITWQDLVNKIDTDHIREFKKKYMDY